MTFTDTWYDLVEELEQLSDDTVITTPLTHKKLSVSDVQQQRVIVQIDGETRSLKKDQFETLYIRVEDSKKGFDLDNLPIDAEPFATVLSLHPDYTIDRDEGKLKELEVSARHTELEDRNTPDIELYSDTLLLIDALELYDIENVENMETTELVNFYTLLSDVQRKANDLRKAASNELLQRVEDNSEVHGQFGSVQKTTRKLRELRNEDEVVETLENVGVSEDRVTGVVEDKVKQALEVADVPEDEVYDIEKREYVRKAEVNEDVKQSRLQGLKDQLSAFESNEAEELRDEVEELEKRIEELTSFQTGSEIEG